jgi:hypothetical protein
MRRRLAVLLAVVTLGAAPAYAAPPRAATLAASWLASRITPGGYVAALDGTGDVATTVVTGIALAAAGGPKATLDRIAGYLGSHVDAYARSGGTDRPGALGRLALFAAATGRDPNAFGTPPQHLVDRILATRTAVGPYAGLLADPVYNGTFNHALGLLGVAAARSLTPAQQAAAAPAVDYLVTQQCADGGWQNAPRPAVLGTALTACGSGANGPDTNAASLATQALAAFRRAAAHDPLAWWQAAQNAAGGYGYAPGGATDADSTGLAIQAILAAGGSPTSARFTRKRSVSTALLALQVPGGRDRGAFAYIPAADGTLRANLYATAEALPAVVRRPFPLIRSTPTK